MFITDKDFAYFVGILITIGVVIGIVLFIGIPWAWIYIKPWIHAITA